MTRVHYIIERDTKALLSLIPEIQALADSEKNALGFIPSGAFEDAIQRQRLIAALVDVDGTRTFAGYLLHSGVYPNAKVQQIAATPAFRRGGAASALIKALVTDLERVGFISLRADVASDLPKALSFYAKNGFEPIRQRAGGVTRGRTIIIHSRVLESDNLLTFASVRSESQIDISHRRSLTDAPVFAFDLNVYFDLVRDRSNSEKARRLFGAALGHTIRLAVTDEFITELRNTSKGVSTDPILQMALQLPRLPKCETKELEAVASKLHALVFERSNAKGAGTDQARSDVKHLAHAALSKASAFVTRDGALLKARSDLLEQFDIDVATVEEVLDLLPNEIPAVAAIKLQGDGFDSGTVTDEELHHYLSDVEVNKALAIEFIEPPFSTTIIHRQAIRCNGRVVAIGILAIPKRIDPVARMLVHVRNELHDAELFADYLIDSLARIACEGVVAVVELEHLPGQSLVNQAAKSRGFRRSNSAANFKKISVGKPLTTSTWNGAIQQIRRRTGLILPDNFDSLSRGAEVPIRTSAGQQSTITTQALEDLLSPTLLIWGGRNAVIVPITREYADELLGTAIQEKFEFILNREAAFRSQRGYVNSPRAARQMLAGAPIIFYESKGRSNGRGAAIAAARIINSVVISKSQLNPKTDARLVIDDLDAFSASDDVLLTTFDNLMRFPNPVGFDTLKKYNAVGKINLVSAVSISSEQTTSILDHGWSGGKF